MKWLGEFRCKNLYAQPIGQNSYWQHLLKDKDPTLRLLYCLHPLIEYAFNELNQIYQQKQILKKLIKADDLLRWVETDLTDQMRLIFLQVAVTEMHEVKQQGVLQAQSTTARFDEYANYLAQPNSMRKLFSKYPELESSLNCLIVQFIHSRTEFLMHLVQDWRTIKSKLLAGGDPFSLIAIDSGMDHMCHGKTNLVLTFKQKKRKAIKVVYRPRSVAVEVRYNKFIAWLNRRKISESLYELTVVDRKDHGWIEYISQQSAQSHAEIQKFYKRFGMLIAIMYLLRGSDGDTETIIAYGAHPVVINVESLFNPKLNYRPGISSVDRFLISDTHMLSKIFMRSDTAQRPIASIIPLWKKAGTDQMSFEKMQHHNVLAQNNPMLLGQPIDAVKYQDSVTAGFDECYKLIQQCKKQLLDKKSTLSTFQNCDIRLSFRAWNEYKTVLANSYQPELLASRRTRKQYFQQLGDIKTIYHSAQQIVKAEVQDLSIGNMPFFSSKVKATDVRDCQQRIVAPLILKSGWRMLRKHLQEQFNAADLKVQKQLIANHFAAARANRIAHPKSLGYARLVPRYQMSQRYLQQRSLMMSRKIINELYELRIHDGEQISWPTIDLINRQSWQTNVTRLDLYSGNMGMALLFAYAGELFSTSKYQRVTESCLNDLRYRFANCTKNRYSSAEQFPEFYDLSAYTGIGSHIYMLSKLLQLNAYADVKRLLSSLITHAAGLVEHDDVLDYLHGMSGFMSVLLTLHGNAPHESYLELLRRCCHGILQKYPQPNQLPEMLATQSADQPLLGMSHGVAGFSYTLATYYHLEKDQRVRQWIDAALAYMRQQYVAKQQDWPDLRAMTKKIDQSDLLSWCHGASGIGMSLAEIQHRMPKTMLAEELDIALNATLRKFKKVDNLCLCHGQFGNLDFLLQLQELQHPQVDQEVVNEYWAYTLAQIEQGDYQHQLQAQGHLPGLMLGKAGIAYQLLRLAYPDIVPSVLLLK